MGGGKPYLLRACVHLYGDGTLTIVSLEGHLAHLGLGWHAYAKSLLVPRRREGESLQSDDLPNIEGFE
jgi:hypothetical protein